MTAPDDLTKGMHVAISGCRDVDHTGNLVDQPFNGVPLRVLAVSLPFIAVTDGEDCFGIDIRFYSVQKLDKEYAKALLEARPRRRDAGGQG